MGDFKDVLFHEHAGKKGDLGVITLNRPAALNSLNAAMIQAIYKQLQRWAAASHIKAVVIKAVEGRAFCAGGDIKSVYEGRKNQEKNLHLFFRDEYQLNKFIFHFPKPYIALLNGITMGGGVGISLHGSHRVATDNLVFAMPETGIGFFPDVGGTYFLPRLPYHIGFYLGLTGERIRSDECVALNLAQHKIEVTKQQDLLSAIADTAFTNDANTSVTNVINDFSIACEHSQLFSEQAVIADCFGKDNLETIIASLQTSEATICQQALESLKKKSPTSLKVTLRALQIGANLNFDECMRQEYRLVNHFLQHHDFIEGIRALIIDKDQKPQWQPASLEEVSENSVEKYFSPLTTELA